MSTEKHPRKGRFAKGNRGGTGNPFNCRVAKYRRAIAHAANEEEAVRVGKEIIAAAIAGDVAAAKVFLEVAHTVNRR